MLRGQRGQLLTDTRWVRVQEEVLVAYEENGCVTRGLAVIGYVTLFSQHTLVFNKIMSD